LARILNWIAVIGIHFLAFVLACDIGLHYSAPVDAPPNRLAWPLALLTATVCFAGFLDWLIYRWSVRTRSSRSWIAVAVIGGTTSVLASPVAAIVALLLASATWGRTARGDLAELNRLVGTTISAWSYPLVFLAAGLVLVGASFAATGRKRPILAFAGAGVALASVLAALLCTALLST
jgi:hypothetical protein